MIGKCSLCNQEKELQVLPIKVNFNYCTDCYKKMFAMIAPKAKVLLNRRKKPAGMIGMMQDSKTILEEIGKEEVATHSEKLPT